MPNATAPDDTNTPRKLKNPDHITANSAGSEWGVDHGRDCVGGIVKAVDEFEAQRNQQRHHQEQVGQIIRYFGASGINVGINAVGDKQQSGSQDAEENDHRQRVETLVEIGSCRRLDRPALDAFTKCNIGHDDELRFRSSRDIAATSDANFGIKGALATR